MPDDIGFDRLVDAYFDAHLWKDSLPAPYDYHALKLELLERVFGTSLDHGEGEAPFDSSDTERDRRSVMGIARACLRRNAESRLPFRIYLEGGPGAMEARLLRNHADAIGKASDDLSSAYRALFAEALQLLFPHARNRGTTMTALRAAGLPLEEPGHHDWL